MPKPRVQWKKAKIAKTNDGLIRVQVPAQIDSEYRLPLQRALRAHWNDPSDDPDGAYYVQTWVRASDPHVEDGGDPSGEILIQQLSRRFAATLIEAIDRLIEEVHEHVTATASAVEALQRQALSQSE
jgi:hypothetical protein